MTFYSEEYSLTEAQIFASELGIFLLKLNNRIKGDVGKSYSYKKLSGSSVEKIIEEAKKLLTKCVSKATTSIERRKLLILNILSMFQAIQLNVAKLAELKKVGNFIKNLLFLDETINSENEKGNNPPKISILFFIYLFKFL